MTTWEEIRDEIAGMLADGQPLEDVIGKLEQHKNEMAKANLLKAMDDMKKREQTNEEWIKSLDTEQLAEWIASVAQKAISIKENNGIVMLESAIWWVEWLKQPHAIKE